MPRARILVLEHHRDLREALVEALLDEGYLVTPAPNLAAALLALRTAGEGQVPDAVVLDIQDGRSLLPELRAQPRYADTAVVSLSFGYEPPTGADADVRRPFRLEQLLAAVRGALERRRSAEAEGEAPTHPHA